MRHCSGLFRARDGLDSIFLCPSVFRLLFVPLRSRRSHINGCDEGLPVHKGPRGLDATWKTTKWNHKLRERRTATSEDSRHILCLRSRYCRQDDFPTHRIQVAHLLKADGVLALERRVAFGDTASLSSLQPCISLGSRLLPSTRPNLRYGSTHACHLVRGAWGIKLRSVVDHTTSERVAQSALM
jgi:hypothetical protein